MTRLPAARLLAGALPLVLAAGCGSSGRDAGLAAGPAAPTSGTPLATASASPTAVETPPRPVPTTQPPATTAPAATTPPPPGEPVRDPAQRYEVSLTVLQSPEHGPELCAGAVLDSYPPQCGGVPVRPFSWATVGWAESYGGTTWAEVRLVGTFDGRVFHPTEPPARPRPPARDPDADGFDSACPEPPGGWRVVDRDTASEADRDAAIEYANRQRDVAAVWLSWLRPAGEYSPPDDSVLNLAFTGDLDRHRAAARKLYGGPLCVTRMARTRAELSRVQDRLTDAREEATRAGVHVYTSSVDEVDNVVSASVLIADAVSRRWVDERFGPGLIRLHGIFRPVAAR